MHLITLLRCLRDSTAVLVVINPTTSLWGRGVVFYGMAVCALVLQFKRKEVQVRLGWNLTCWSIFFSLRLIKVWTRENGTQNGKIFHLKFDAAKRYKSLTKFSTVKQRARKTTGSNQPNPNGGTPAPTNVSYHILRSTVRLRPKLVVTVPYRHNDGTGPEMIPP